jgi:hypothetical protein
MPDSALEVVLGFMGLLGEAEGKKKKRGPTRLGGPIFSGQHLTLPGPMHVE